MTVKEKIYMDHKSFCENGSVNIVILGDSVSQGSLADGCDYENVYWNRVKKMLNSINSEIPVNMICSAIGGTTASFALNRLKKGVFDHSPDLVIICFGLNDVNGEKDEYLSSLREIFSQCNNNNNVPAIFMTPNMLNTYVAEDTLDELKGYAEITAKHQISGRMDDYIYSAVNLAEEMNITVCDCYSEWKLISESEDTTLMLINRINHPTAEMHQLFAEKLFKIIMQ